MLTVGVPENNRALRQRLRTQLGWAGLGSPTPGVWVTPRVDREPQARRVLEELDLLAGSWSFVAAAGQVGDERSLARAAWDLDEVEQRYEDFLELVSRRRPRTDRQALVAQVRLVQEWRRFPLLDPGLPRELLPPRWSGSRAAEVFRERHAAWAPRATAAWAELGRRRLTPASGGDAGVLLQPGPAGVGDHPDVPLGLQQRRVLPVELGDQVAVRGELPGDLVGLELVHPAVRRLGEAAEQGDLRLHGVATRAARSVAAAAAPRRGGR